MLKPLQNKILSNKAFGYFKNAMGAGAGNYTVLLQWWDVVLKKEIDEQCDVTWHQDLGIWSYFKQTVM